MRAIMYVGAKALKIDNKNNDSSRVWHGLGDVVANIPEPEAVNLLKHPDAWMDVTNLGDAAVRKVIEGRQEEFRQQQRRSLKSDVKQMLGTLSDDELAAELSRRSSVRGRAERTGKPLKPAPTKPNPSAQSLSQEGDQQHRPDNFKEVAADILGAILSLDRETGYDSNGQPYPEKVRVKLGYHVTDQEVVSCFSTMQKPSGK